MYHSSEAFYKALRCSQEHKQDIALVKVGLFLSLFVRAYIALISYGPLLVRLLEQ